MNLRKTLLLLLSFLVVGSFVFAEGNQESEAEQVELRIAWWGNAPRHDLHNAIWDNFEEQNPDITVTREFAATSDYWRKLTTQIAGGNAPDLFICQYIQFEDFVKRGVVLPLDDLISSGDLDVSGLAPAHIQNGTYNGKMYGVSIGGSIRAIFYNTEMFAEAGIDPLPEDWTWQDLEEIGAKFKATFTDPDVYLLEDLTSSLEAGDALQSFIRGYGYDYFTDGELGFPKSVFKEWLELGVRFREKGYFPPAEVQTELGNAPKPESMLVKKLVAMQVKPSNQFPLFQNPMDDKLEVQLLPGQEGSNAGSGSFIGSTNWVISSRTEHPEAAARALNYFTNTKEAVDIWKIQLGPLPNTEMLEYIKPQLSEPNQRVVEFTNEMLPKIRPIAGFPDGGVEVINSLRAITQKVSYNKLTVDEAVEEYYALADQLLK